MPLVCYVSERDINTPLDAERLLRLLGVSGKLSGFYFAVYMIEQVRQKPDHILLVTKRLYKQTARHFGTTSSCVERNLRTLINPYCFRCGDTPVRVRFVAEERTLKELLRSYFSSLK